MLAAASDGAALVHGGPVARVAEGAAGKARKSGMRGGAVGLAPLGTGEPARKPEPRRADFGQTPSKEAES
jgi:hypothetical protein